MKTITRRLLAGLLLLLLVMSIPLSALAEETVEYDIPQEGDQAWITNDWTYQLGDSANAPYWVAYHYEADKIRNFYFRPEGYGGINKNYYLNQRNTIFTKMRNNDCKELMKWK